MSTGSISAWYWLMTAPDRAGVNGSLHVRRTNCRDTRRVRRFAGSMTLSTQSSESVSSSTSIARRRPWCVRRVAHFANIAVTSTLNHHVWPRELRDVEQGRGRDRRVPERLGPAGQGLSEEPDVGDVRDDPDDVVHGRALETEQLLDLHVRVPALLGEVALVHDLPVAFPFGADAGEKDDLAGIGDGHHLRELALGPLVVAEVLLLEATLVLRDCEWRTEHDRQGQHCGR